MWGLMEAGGRLHYLARDNAAGGARGMRQVTGGFYPERSAARRPRMEHDASRRSRCSNITSSAWRRFWRIVGCRFPAFTSSTTKGMIFHSAVTTGAGCCGRVDWREQPAATRCFGARRRRGDAFERRLAGCARRFAGVAMRRKPRWRMTQGSVRSVVQGRFRLCAYDPERASLSTWLTSSPAARRGTGSRGAGGTVHLDRAGKRSATPVSR